MDDRRQAVEVLEYAVKMLRSQGVKAFKGDLRVSDQITWSLDLTFERPEQRRRSERDE